MALHYLACFSATSLLAQGTVVLNNRVVGSVVTHIYAPLSGDSSFRQVGNGSGDTPPGSIDWSAFTVIGANTGGPYGAATTFAQIIGAHEFNQPESSLQPALPVTTFRTGPAAGFVAPVTATLGNVGMDQPATVEVVVWDNSSGLYPTWTEASAAWRAGLIAAAESGTFNQFTPTITSEPPNLTGLQSFDLYYVVEPSLIALAGFGGALLLFSRQIARE